MESRNRRSARFFKSDEYPDLYQPGEYGSSHNPDGWVVMTVAGQTIYLASENYATKLAEHYKIPAANVVCLNRADKSQKTGIPETILPGAEGFALFNERLQKITRKQNPILIHCKHGMNRTPVAAVLYLISQHIEPVRAVALVAETYREQRDANFELNSRGHYSLVLEHMGIAMPARNRRTSTL